MQTALRSLIALSFVGGLALFLCPKGGPGQILKLLVTAVLISALITPLRDLDYDFLSLEEAKFSSAEAGLLQEAQQRESALKKQLFTQNCERYIEARAEELGVRIRRITVDVIGAGEEDWAPYSVRLEASGSPEAMEALCQLIRDTLGVPAERQVWSADE